MTTTNAALILNASQAQAVYSAAIILANVGANKGFRIDEGRWEVRVSRSGGVIVEKVSGIEHHDSWNAFAAAYGLPVAAPDLVAALRAAYSDIQRLPGHTIDMLGRIEAALELSAA